MTDSIIELQKRIAAFRDARNWKQFHEPKDLAISISLEAAELLEVFQWSGSDTSAVGKENKIKEELADVMMYCFLLADRMDLDISEIITDKLALNEKKTPSAKPTAALINTPLTSRTMIDHPIPPREHQNIHIAYYK